MAGANGIANRRRRAGASVAIAVACAALTMVVPASAGAAGLPSWWPTTTAKTTTTTVPTTTSSTAPTTTTTGVPVGPCGALVKKADGTAWQCTWVDDFDGTTLDPAHWIAQQTANSGFTSGVECNMDSPDNVSVADGVLRLTARKEAAPFTCTDPGGDFTTQYTAGSVSTYQRFSQAYGRFEVRAKFPAATVKGLQSAIWLWPDDATKYGPWPTSGEIDIAEAYSLYPDRVIPYIHYTPWGGDAKATNNYCMISDLSQFHTYVAEWTTKTISIIYDGKVCTIDNWNPALPLFKPQPFDQPFMVALTQALGLGKNGFDPAITPLPAVTQVDYVRVWR